MRVWELDEDERRLVVLPFSPGPRYLIPTVPRFRMRDVIKGKKWLLLSRWKNLAKNQRGVLNRVFHLNRRVLKAYLLKESLERLWDYRYAGAMLNYLQKWIKKDIPMTSWWENESIMWTEGIKQIDLVIKDDSGGGGHAHKRADHENYFPTKVRITMVRLIL